MVTGSTTTSAQTQQNKGAELMRHLRSIARQYKVCYEIWPVWSTLEEVKTRIGFELVLCGVNGHLRREGGVLHQVTGCQHCALSFAELRELAAWLVPLKQPPLSYTMHPFDQALHLAPSNRQRRSEIIITTAIFDQACDNQPDHRESECLKEVRERLSRLGIREDVSFTAKSGNPRS